MSANFRPSHGPECRVERVAGELDIPILCSMNLNISQVLPGSRIKETAPDQLELSNKVAVFIRPSSSRRNVYRRVETVCIDCDVILWPSIVPFGRGYQNHTVVTKGRKGIHYRFGRYSRLNISSNQSGQGIANPSQEGSLPGSFWCRRWWSGCKLCITIYLIDLTPQLLSLISSSV